MLVPGTRDWYYYYLFLKVKRLRKPLLTSDWVEYYCITPLSCSDGHRHSLRLSKYLHNPRNKKKENKNSPLNVLVEDEPLEKRIESWRVEQVMYAEEKPKIATVHCVGTEIRWGVHANTTESKDKLFKCSASVTQIDNSSWARGEITLLGCNILLRRSLATY